MVCSRFVRGMKNVTRTPRCSLLTSFAMLSFLLALGRTGTTLARPSLSHWRGPNSSLFHYLEEANAMNPRAGRAASFAWAPLPSFFLFLFEEKNSLLSLSFVMD